MIKLKGMYLFPRALTLYFEPTLSITLRYSTDSKSALEE